jgi:hypothetical protein
MGPLTDDVTGTRDFAFWETIDEVLVEAREQIDYARNTERMVSLVIRLKMAERALQCALEIYGDKVAEMQKEKT